MSTVCLGLFGLLHSHMTQGGLAIISKATKMAVTQGYSLYFEDSNNGTILVDGGKTMMTV